MDVQMGELCQLNSSPRRGNAMMAWFEVRMKKKQKCGNLAIAIEITVAGIV